jgi:hypothetical protein
LFLTLESAAKPERYPVQHTWLRYVAEYKSLHVVLFEADGRLGHRACASVLCIRGTPSSPKRVTRLYFGNNLQLQTRRATESRSTSCAVLRLSESACSAVWTLQSAKTSVIRSSVFPIDKFSLLIALSSGSSFNSECRTRIYVVDSIRLWRTNHGTVVQPRFPRGCTGVSYPWFQS